MDNISNNLTAIMDTNFLQQVWTWRPTAKDLSSLLPLLIVAYYAHGYFQKGLFKVPGPFLGSLSDWYRIFYVVKGRRQDRHQALMHKKYGDVVRYGPNLISFGHPDAIKDIYGIGKSLGKSPFYLPMQAMAKGRAFASLFTILTNKEHSHLKRTISNAFSGSSIVSLEPLVEEVVHDWIKQTEVLYVKPGKSCNLGWWMQLFAFDAITNLTYSKTHGMVKQHRDVDGICTWLEGMFAYAAVVGSMPILDQLWNKNPLKRFLEWTGLSAPSFATVRFTRKRMAERLSRDENDESFTKAERPDLLGQFIVNSQRHPSVLDQQMVMAQTNSIAFAGSDNTSVTLTAVVYYLLRNPRCYKRAVAELDEAARTGGMPENPYEIPTWAQCQKLTYFNACVKEAGRLHPSVAGILERMTPPEGAYIMGKWYPGNTLVGCNAWVLHHRKDTWGEDADDFRPERWLESSPEDLDKMNRAFFSFSSGPRVCIGRNISLLEIGKLIPVMLRVFDVRLVNPDKEWELRNNFVMKQLGVEVMFKLRQH